MFGCGKKSSGLRQEIRIPPFSLRDYGGKKKVNVVSLFARI